MPHNTALSAALGFFVLFVLAGVLMWANAKLGGEA